MFCCWRTFVQYYMINYFTVYHFNDLLYNFLSTTISLQLTSVLLRLVSIVLSTTNEAVLAAAQNDQQAVSRYNYISHTSSVLDPLSLTIKYSVLHPLVSRCLSCHSCFYLYLFQHYYCPLTHFCLHILLLISCLSSLHLLLLLLTHTLH